ncbi:hypothetical protein GBA52_004174 [Prunus armeniaca]|nr:hypothetical protein GBA52_004174 [Prunus armeniaca]
MAVESVLTFAAEGILTKLTDLAAHEISLAWGFKAELKRLRKTLSTIEGYLADVAQGPQGRSKSVEDWMTNLKRLAQDADDVLDEFNYELLRRKVEIRNHMKKKVLNFFSLSNPVAFRLKIAHKIQKINASLVDLKSEAPVIGLVSRQIDAAPQGIRGRMQTDSFPEKDGIIVGREEVVSNIVTTLTNSNINQENIAVMAIVGMAGLGKTTLAKSVYNDDSKYFEKRMWVCVSDPFNINVILICMLESLNPSKATVRENQDALLKYLEEELRAKRYLLVLDDVWNEDSEKWESLMSYLSKLNSAPGSKIIVTTRSGIVASLTETLPRPELKLLSTDECWSILKHAACSDGSSDIPLGLERIGQEIAKNCEGLPLMAKVLGGILCSKKTPVEWSKVKDNRIWDLPKTGDRIMSVLKLSFDNLESPALKQCFSYCSAFIKDEVMERDDLIQLWMAQGFLHPFAEKSNLEMEDIGNEYFDILFQSSLFQNATVDDDGIVTKCMMHDLVHDLAERVSESGSMMRDFPEIQDVATSSIIERIPEGSSGKLRSLVWNAEALPGNMLPWFKALRVLKLCGPYIEELPSSIGKLKHLRYLDISFTNIKRLPNSIGKLYNLQTLRATYCDLEEFPKDVQNLINLRHVYCDKETKFPTGVLGRLTSLRKLPYSYEDYKVMGREIVELAALNQLKGKLIICNLEDVRNGDEASKAKLEEKKKVRHFIFEWTENRSTTNNNEEDVLEGLQPHSELERLEIKYFMGTKFPSWMIKLGNLKQIMLEGCNRCEKVPTLGHLPHLTVVWIKGMDNLKCVGEADSHLPSLKELEIRYCEKLTCIAHYIFGCCASLRKLAVYSCSSLQSIPDLHSFTSLCELTIECCERLESLVSSGPVSVVELLTIEGCSDLQSIPDLNLFPSLRVLSIESCERLESLVSSGPVSLVELLTIKGCSGLQSIPDLNLFPSLCELSIESCERLESLVSSGPVSVVELLTIKGCSGLQSIPALSYLTSLRQLIIEDCGRVRSLGSSGPQLPASLVELKIRNAPNLESLPSLDNLTSLSELVIVNCGKLKYLPTGLHCCASLNTLVLGSFWEELDSFPDFHLETGSSQLQTLILTGWPKLKSLPQQIQDFTSLTYLVIHKFDGVEALEDWLGNLTSLDHLDIRSCKKLMYLPSVEAMQRLTKLQTLIIWECPLLKERCTKDSGPEWPKISHIPHILILGPDSRQIDSMRTMNS